MKNGLLKFAEDEWRKATDKLTYEKLVDDKERAFYTGMACAYNSIIVKIDTPTLLERIISRIKEVI